MTTKLQRIDADTETTVEATLNPNLTTLKNGVTIEDLEDFSKRIVIPANLIKDGLVVVFRDPSHEDFEQFEKWLKDCATKTEAMRRLGCRLCTRWNDRDGVTPEQWNKIRTIASATLLHILNSFFPGEEDF
jgi:hypothetical protein